MYRGGHDFPHCLVKRAMLAHGLHHVALGDDAVYPVGIDHDDRQMRNLTIKRRLAKAGVQGHPRCAG